MSEHDWECVDEGMYDSLYKCTACNLEHMVSMDNPSTILPTTPCTAAIHPPTVRDVLFKGFSGCGNHYCVIDPPTGMGTNGPCHCIRNLTRTQLSILTSRLMSVADIEIPTGEDNEGHE